MTVMDSPVSCRLPHWSTGCPVRELVNQGCTQEVRQAALTSSPSSVSLISHRFINYRPLLEHANNTTSYTGHGLAAGIDHVDLSKCTLLVINNAMSTLGVAIMLWAHWALRLVFGWLSDWSQHNRINSQICLIHSFALTDARPWNSLRYSKLANVLQQKIGEDLATMADAKFEQFNKHSQTFQQTLSSFAKRYPCSPSVLWIFAWSFGKVRRLFWDLSFSTWQKNLKLANIWGIIGEHFATIWGLLILGNTHL